MELQGILQLAFSVSILWSAVLHPFASGVDSRDLSIPAVSPHDLSEYCKSEVFRARCSSNEVIVITDAVYGISSLGRCVQTPHEHIGCRADVKDYLNGKCSGRRACEIDIPDEVMEKLAGCPQEYDSYLTASYKCLRVASSCQSCVSSGNAPVPATVVGVGGYIASILTSEFKDDEQACGAARCPWLIQVKPGQRINLTLFDYSPWSMQQLLPTQQPTSQAVTQSSQAGGARSRVGAGGGGTSSEHCYRYAIIKERANPKDTTVCGVRLPRERHLYTSISNTLEVSVVGTGVLKGDAQIVIHYQAIGCLDITPPKYSRMRRREDVVTIDCPADGQEWTLTCVGNQWKGEEALGKCTPEVHAVAPLNPGQKLNPSAAPVLDPGSNELSFEGFWKTLKSLPMGIILTLVVAVAVIIIVLMITSGTFCIKKRQFDKKHKPATGIYGQPCSEFEFRQDLDGAGAYLVPKGGQTMPVKSSRHESSEADLARDNTYGGGERRWESRPLPSIPRAGTDRSRRSGDYPNPNPAQQYPMGNGVRPCHPPNGGYPNGYHPQMTGGGGGYPTQGTTCCSPPNGWYPSNGSHPGNSCRAPPNGMDPRHCHQQQHPSYPGSNGGPHHPNHCAAVGNHPGYPGQFGSNNYPPGTENSHFNPNFQNGSGPFPGHAPNLVTVQMHRPDPGHFRGAGDQQMQRRSAPLGTAAVVFRGGGGGGGPHNRSNAPSGENAYFVLDADAVVDEPIALLADPMSLPRTTQNRFNTDNHHNMRGGGGGGGGGGGPPTAMVRSMGADEHADSFLKPLVTADGKCVEDIILNPIDHPGTNGKFYVAPSPPDKNSQEPFHSNGSVHQKLVNGSNEKWPPPPPPMMDSTPVKAPYRGGESYENGGSLQAAVQMRPAHDNGHGHKRSIASGADIDMMVGGNNPLGSLP